MSTRRGFAFSTAFRVRYAEIDGQKVVFNSRYLEYVDVAATEFWEWTRIAEALGTVWTEAEFHVRRADVEFLKPFVWGDTVEVFVRNEKIGRTSITQRFEMCHADTGALHAIATLVVVQVDLSSGVPTPIPDPVRAFLEQLPEA